MSWTVPYAIATFGVRERAESERYINREDLGQETPSHCCNP